TTTLSNQQNHAFQSPEACFPTAALHIESRKRSGEEARGDDNSPSSTSTACDYHGLRSDDVENAAVVLAHFA
ncbi:hypothetical protein, partial [Corynebacterium sp. SA-MJD20WY100]|uniref:hypothetical protein n=1 Tax=Corynebacterium sp. SA-MJD20WY100 TaxID=3142969 RepID=UPI003221F9C2